MKEIKKWFFSYWRQVLGFIAGLSFLIFLYTFQLNSLTGGFSKIENNYIASTSSLKSITSETVFLPHKIMSFATTAIPGNGIFVRFPSALLMIVMIGCFYVLMARWYTTRIAILSTLLFATSSWTLTLGRQALPTVLYMGWLPILAILYWTTSKAKQSITILLWSISLGLSLYIPGLLWFALVLAVSQRQRLKRILENAPFWQIVVGILFLVALCIPFILSAVNTPSIALQSIAIPTSINQLTSFPLRLLQILTQIFIFSSGNPVFHLGRLPYLDVASSILFLVGIYRLRYSSARKMMGWSGIITLGWLIGAGLSTVNVAIFLPLIYVFIGGGLSFLLVQWYKVFPRNPIARTLASTAITTLVLLISFYQLSRYYIAWPLNPATKSVFSYSNGKINK